MFATDQYQLLDFGAGRKLERFGPYRLDRPAPAARDVAPRKRDLWSTADARFERAEGERGRWSLAREIEPSWYVHHGPLALEVKLTEFGHLGLFPEQAENWKWIAQQVRAAREPLKILNLFAYTGAGTLAAAAAGAEVTHVDAAANVVAWARRNAAASGLVDAPVRWIAEDAIKFVRRELKRGHRYHAVVLDPPGYGHGPHGETWKLEEMLGELLGLCLELTAGQRRFILLSCHSGDWGWATELLKYVVSAQPALRDEGTITGRNMSLVSREGGSLHAGATVRWHCHRPTTPPRSANRPEPGRSTRLS
jgi:23S rRNA (cytosine1962-C5)-methyltransferase